eukprot:18808-Heterococcus_DN1.PRE.3
MMLHTNMLLSTAATTQSLKGGGALNFTVQEVTMGMRLYLPSSYWCSSCMWTAVVPSYEASCVSQHQHSSRPSECYHGSKINAAATTGEAAPAAAAVKHLNASCVPFALLILIREGWSV